MYTKNWPGELTHFPSRGGKKKKRWIDRHLPAHSFWMSHFLFCPDSSKASENEISLFTFYRQGHSPCLNLTSHLVIILKILLSLYTTCSVVQLCPTLCGPMAYSLYPTESYSHGIFQARTLEQVAISYSRGFSQPRDQTHVSYVSCTGRCVLYH